MSSIHFSAGQTANPYFGEKKKKIDRVPAPQGLDHRFLPVSKDGLYNQEDINAARRTAKFLRDKAAAKV